VEEAGVIQSRDAGHDDGSKGEEKARHEGAQQRRQKQRQLKEGRDRHVLTFIG